MKTSPYTFIPLHHRPDLMKQCCDLLNNEWYRSDTARLTSLKESCDGFPTCLVLIHNDTIVGHCKITLTPSVSNSCIIQSVIINPDFRSQGLGSMLMREAEKYVFKRGIRTVYLTTKGQEEFYLKNDYVICEPIDLFNYSDFAPDPIARATLTLRCNSDRKINCQNIPPPPPMPMKINKPPVHILTNRTFMMKKL